MIRKLLILLILLWIWLGVYYYFNPDGFEKNLNNVKNYKEKIFDKFSNNNSWTELSWTTLLIKNDYTNEYISTWKKNKVWQDSRSWISYTVSWDNLEFIINSESGSSDKTFIIDETESVEDWKKEVVDVDGSDEKEAIIDKIVNNISEKDSFTWVIKNEDKQTNIVTKTWNDLKNNKDKNEEKTIKTKTVVQNKEKSQIIFIKKDWYLIKKYNNVVNFITQKTLWTEEITTNDSWNSIIKNLFK